MTPMQREVYDLINMVSLDLASTPIDQRSDAAAAHLNEYLKVLRHHFPEATEDQVLGNMAALALAVFKRVAQIDLSAGIVGRA